MRRTLRKGVSFTLAAATFGCLSFGAAASDVGFGIGVSYIFGQGPAVGIKAFTDDEENKGAGAVGLDYVFASNAFRPNIGIGYQGSGYFADGNIGYNLKNHTLDFATGTGWSDADDDSSSTPPPPPSPQFPSEQ